MDERGIKWIFQNLLKQKMMKEKRIICPTWRSTKGDRSGKDIVRVVVGHDKPHPNTVEHHIAWIEFYGVKKDADQVIALGRAVCAPFFSNPNVRFQVNQIADFKAFHALAYCNIHGLWANSLER